MINHVIEVIIESGLRTKSVFVILKNDTPTVAYRRAEAIMPHEADVDTFLLAEGVIEGLWAIGEDSSEGAYLAPGDQTLIVPIYQPIIRQIFQALAGPADLDLIRGQIIAILQQSPATYDNFVAAIQKLDIDASTPEGKREQLLWAVLLALVGMFNAEFQSA